jgi:hypothetical protein
MLASVFVGLSIQYLNKDVEGILLVVTKDAFNGLCSKFN